jgi:hypothetical protein
MESMNSTQTIPRGAHLVGSVPLGSAEDVFRAISAQLPHHVRRIPDGETGDRQKWVQFQLETLAQLPELEMVSNVVPGMGELPPTLRLREGVRAEDVDFGALGYARQAIESWQTFARLQSEGVVPADVRFQVSMPTPLANATAWLQFDPQFEILRDRYITALLRELDAIVAAIPADRLAIQWDVCFEVLMYEGWMPMPAGVDRDWIADHLVAISEAVPTGVELGYHFCFGDFNHEHAAQPTDAGRVVELAQSFFGRVQRPVNWLHLPVPIDRDDDAYFAPLKDLPVPDGAEVYIGLLHFRDGIDGARRRSAAAGRSIAVPFGVATECGMGRRPVGRGGGSELEQLLQLHADASAAVR